MPAQSLPLAFTRCQISPTAHGWVEPRAQTSCREDLWAAPPALACWKSAGFPGVLPVQPSSTCDSTGCSSAVLQIPRRRKRPGSALVLPSTDQAGSFLSFIQQLLRVDRHYRNELGSWHLMIPLDEWNRASMHQHKQPRKERHVQKLSLSLSVIWNKECNASSPKTRSWKLICWQLMVCPHSVSPPAQPRLQPGAWESGRHQGRVSSDSLKHNTLKWVAEVKNSQNI